MQLSALDPASGPDAAAVVRVARAVAERGGRALIVGGWVRDRLLQRLGAPVVESKDLDVEVFGLELDALAAVLAAEGPVDAVGKSFAVLMVHGLDVDFSLPRRDRKDGVGHRGFDAQADPSMSVDQAARRRDFTVNAISMDPLTGAIVDPLDGAADLRDGVLRPADPETFGEDPLRALRAVQFAARFGFRGSDGLAAILRSQDLAELPAERVLGEFRKLLLRGSQPSRGIALLQACLHHFPSLGPPDRLRAAGEALDAWVAVRSPDADAALAEGLVVLAGAGLERLGARIKPPVRVMKAARALLAAEVPKTDGDLRALARALGTAGSAIRSRAAIAGPAGPPLLRRAEALGVADAPIPLAVQGRHLLDHGLAPGPGFKPILDACRDLQDATGEQDPEALLSVVLAERMSRPR